MSDWVVLEREFDAPIETVWRMWAEPELFASWYGPNGMSVPEANMDLQVGGTRKIAMTMAGKDMTMWFTGAFKEITPPTRLVYSEAMCDAAGNIIPPSSMGMPEGTPEETQVTVELTDLGGRTRVTLTHAGVPKGSPGEGGWMQALDKLVAALG